MLTVQPLFGLSNRMQALSSVLSLAEEFNRPVTLIWSLNPELNCRFEALFQIPEAVADLRQPRRQGWRYYSGPIIRLGTPESNNPHYLKYLPGIRLFFNPSQDVNKSHLAYRCLAPARYFNKLLFNHYGFHRVLYEFEISGLIGNGFDFRTLDVYSKIYFRAFQFFYSSDSRPFYPFRLADDLRMRVEAEVVRFGTCTVGIHIRRTDHQPAIVHSTTQKFIEAIQAEINEDPAVNFFLATDSPEVDAALRRQFPDRILTYVKRTLDRNSPQGIQDAAVDLYCLSRTQKILGSYQSSFSGFASRIGGNPLKIIC
jgi:hypothetical protein